MDQKIEIRSYIKCRIRLNIDSKQIFNELCVCVCGGGGGGGGQILDFYFIGRTYQKVRFLT